MRAMAGVALVVTLAASTAAAQVARGNAVDGGITFTIPARPAPPDPAPARPPHNQPSPSDRDDLFRADPDTYAPPDPRRDPRVPSQWPWRHGAFDYPAWPLPLVPVAPLAYPRDGGIDRLVVIAVPVADASGPSRAPMAAAAAAAAPAQVQPLEVATPAPTPPAPGKTLYVIPRCYAGDRIPSAAQLPAGCDLANLRVLPPTG